MAPLPSTLARRNPKERKGSNFAIWQPWLTDLEQVVEHCAGSLAHEHDEAAEVDGDADRGETHDDISEEKEREK